MRSIIRLLKKRNKCGFTLVEVVVSVALLAILMGGMMLFIAPIVKSFNNDQKDQSAEGIAACVNNYIVHNIRYATQVAVFSNTNYNDIKDNSAYTARIQAMNKYCTDANGGSGSVNRTYELKCISLRYDDASHMYYVYNEFVNMAANGALDQTKSTKVFSDCFYNDLYMTFEVTQPENGDYGKIENAPVLRNDALKFNINAYRDSSRNTMIYYGEGVTELRNIKGMLKSDKANASKYNISVAPAAPVDFGSMTDGSRDIYIYYIKRTLAVTVTPGA